MDLLLILAIGCVCVAGFWGFWIWFMLNADSDFLTFLALHVGKNPMKVYFGKVIWITGASSGIGEGLAKEFAQLGASLVLSARRKEELEKVKKFCLKLNPKLDENNVLVLPFDMVDLKTHQMSFNRILQHFGTLDVVVSNAGRTQRADWHQIDISVDKELFDLNVFSLVHLNRIALKYFLERSNGGQIVVNSSMGGKFPAPGSASYIGSKYALQGYFHALRNEVRFKNIGVTILCPGAVESGLLSQAFTSQSGVNFGKEMPPDESTMPAERCAVLSAAAMANGIEEAWIGRFPSIPLLYLTAYLPYLSTKLEWYLCKSGLFSKIRGDGDKAK